ncbi:MAG: T9SS type A sorting domain-containing protein [Prolixibacteraceae bacterium]|jgi:hypothetical protein
MKKNSGLYIFLFLVFFVNMADSVRAQLTAFPGAEGFGKYTTGGRGGKVIFVTNLEDNTLAGSLRYAVNQSGARTIVFSVSGTIQLKSNLNIKNGNLTIAGQTAPGDGICIRDYSVVNEADNVIIRFMKFRLGDVSQQQNDCIWGREHKNIIIDHCSMSWSTDECGSFYDNENYTMQWCLLGESLRNSVHDKGSHGYGGIWGGKKASFHHNLLANNDSRNPRLCGSRYSNKPDLEMVDLRNNVFYNWGGNSGYAGEGGSYNFVNNYYKAGPAASSSSRTRIFEPYPDNGGNEQAAGTYGKFYVAGNVMTSSTTVTANNWLGITPNSSFTTLVPGFTKDDLKLDTELVTDNVTTHTAEMAYQKVLDYVGASLVRDTVDKRIIHDARTGIPTITDGGNGSTNGIIDTQSAVGGWPVLNSLPAPTDSDADGMPDAWEETNGLGKTNPADAQTTTVDGKYPNLEVYLNSLVADITANELKDALYTSAQIVQKLTGEVKFFLNNASDLIYITSEKNIKSVKVYSVNGSLLKTLKCSGNSGEISVSELRKGIYIVSALVENGEVYSQKIVRF